MPYLNQNKIIKSGLILILILSGLFSLAQNNSRAAFSLSAALGASPDAIAARVIPNPDNLSPLRWYQANIKNQGSPQALFVDGYEAIRDGRTVYINAANVVDTNNDGVLDHLYTNIYLLSFNQTVDQATEDIFGQLLTHWKFNTNIIAEQKVEVRRDTKRLADLAEIKSALANYQKAHNGDFPSLAAGSYVAGKSLSVWPSWQATLGKELAATLPVDPVNELGACTDADYDAITCWNQTNKSFVNPDGDNNTFDLPAGSQAYIYTYNGAGSYNVCALMQSDYLTTLDQGACPNSTIGYSIDNCGDSAYGLGDYHREGTQCISNKKLNDPTCYYRGTNYDYGWKNFARIWENGAWKTSCTVYNCQDNFYYKYESWSYAGIPVTLGGCKHCYIIAGSGATSVEVRSGCSNAQCTHPCEITACSSGKHPSSDGLTCEANACDAATLPASHTSSCNALPATSNNQAYIKVTACGSTACTFICIGGYTGAACQTPPTYVCNAATLPASHASSCNALPAISNNQSYTKVTACGSTACTFICTGGYTGATCQTPPVYSCGGSTPSSATFDVCSGAAASGQSYIHDETCAQPCSYKCNSSHHLASGSCADNAQNFTCTTVAETNTVWNSSGGPTNTTSNTALLNWVSSGWYPLNANVSSYADSGSFCTYKCATGYDRVGGTCVLSCTATCNTTSQPNCQASAPFGSIPNTTGGTCCGGTSCFKCPVGYTWDGSICKYYTSCLDLKNNGFTVNNSYYIDPDGVGGSVAFVTYCDMTTDGGGWTLIMKIVNEKFSYTDPLWENSSVLNETNFDFTTSGGKSKYPSFNTVSFNKIRTSDINNFGSNYQYDLGASYSSAKALFSGPGIEISSGTLNTYFNGITPANGRHWAVCGSFESTVLNVGINQKVYLTESWGAHVPVYSTCDWNGAARFGQRVNGNHSGSGNITGQGWGASTLVGDAYIYPISQLLWVK